MRATLGTARVEWVRFFRDRIAMFSTIALPIVLVLLIGLSFGQGGGQLPVGLVATQPGPLGTQLVTSLQESPGLSVTTYPDSRDMYRDIRMGLLAGGVAVQADGQPVQIYVQQTSTDAGAVLSAVNAAAAAVGTRAIAVDVLAEEVSQDRAQQAVDDAERTVPAVTVSSRAVGEASQMELNRFASAVPSQLMLFTFLNGLLGAAALVQSRELGVFQRSLAAPRGLPVYIGGLGLSRLAIALLQAAILIGMGILSFQIDFGNPLAWVPLVLVYGVICAAAGMLLGGLCRTTGQAVAIAVPLGIVLGMLGGTMWPLSVVPPVMRFIGHLTPQGWAMDAWNLIMNDGAGPVGVAQQLGVLLVFAVVLSLLALWAVGRHARTGR
jgi:ABC-2 type transport system permease protein